MERKLAAILYADVVAYSRLTGEDEEGTHATLSMYLDVLTESIKTHGGKVVHFAGDAVLAEFSSVLQALASAVDGQRTINDHNERLTPQQQMQFRIGVNLGDVIVDRNDLYGDGVNIAARLETLAEPGGVCISQSVRDAVGNKLPYFYNFLGEKSVKNIANPVRAYHVSMDQQETSSELASGMSGFGGKTLWGGTLAAIIVAGAVLWLKPWVVEEMASVPTELESAEKTGNSPVIAVLPFDNMSDSKEQAYFSDGMTEDLITDLSKVPGLTVIARTSSFSYRGRSMDVRSIAKNLSARYVLEGSVRRAGGKLRINAQLIDAETGLHLWAERYDAEAGDIFSLQDQITEKIVASLALTLNSGEREDIERPDTANLAAYELFLQGRDMFKRFSKNHTYLSRGYFKKALKLDPKYAHAYAMLAWSYVFEYTNGWSESNDEVLQTALDYANEAIALNDSIPVAYFAKGLVFRERYEYVQALVEAQKSIEIDPNYANGHVLLATLLYYAGRPAEGLAMIQKAQRLHPLHPSNYPFHEGQALFILKRYDEAINAFEKGLKQNDTSQRLRVWLAATYAQVGRQEDAQWEAEQVLMSDPNFSLKRLPQAFPFKDKKELDHIVGALRKAGFMGAI